MVTQQKKEKIKKILSNMKVDLAVDLSRVELPQSFKDKEEEIWVQFNAEEKKIKDLPIKKAIEKKFADADMGMYIKDITYTPEEQKFLETNPSQLKMEKLLTERLQLEKQEQEALKERLKNNTASESEKKALESVEFKIWDSGKEMLGEKGNDLPAFSVDSDFYAVFNNYGDMEATSLPEKTECTLRQQLNEIGVDYESYDYAYKVLFERDRPLSKTEFLEKNSSCKKWIKPKPRGK